MKAATGKIKSPRARPAASWRRPPWPTSSGIMCGSGRRTPSRFEIGRPAAGCNAPACSTWPSTSSGCGARWRPSGNRLCCRQNMGALGLVSARPCRLSQTRRSVAGSPIPGGARACGRRIGGGRSAPRLETGLRQSDGVRGQARVATGRAVAGGFCEARGGVPLRSVGGRSLRTLGSSAFKSVGYGRG